MRKAGASALNAMNISMFTLRRWGLWKTFTSPEKYYDPTYTVDPQTRQLFDHLCEGGLGMQMRQVDEHELTDDLTDEEDSLPTEITAVANQ
jgi:hypothetical protein